MANPETDRMLFRMATLSPEHRLVLGRHVPGEEVIGLGSLACDWWGLRSDADGGVHLVMDFRRHKPFQHRLSMPGEWLQTTLEVLPEGRDGNAALPRVDDIVPVCVGADPTVTVNTLTLPLADASEHITGRTRLDLQGPNLDVMVLSRFVGVSSAEGFFGAVVQQLHPPKELAILER